MISQQYLKLLMVFFGLIAIITPIAKGSRPPKKIINNSTKIPKCGKVAAQCTKGKPWCSSGTPKCSNGGVLKNCASGVTC
ncbi:uncharacterized protein MELLADRAFT_124481 [Melampsora larici-populina 98AG31]|uniref:Secreted protein n=1 Tax=Melampsora larici-populina (strain 98AG31 / pathotype 3-4-7) TaxID=747676 RepID=F4S385_MELLP|nr:uncharacterized protein MELLADRAFT_124481 [Melampsora larici-populina 98AG31]EGG00955.1 secreted protein [Melampsora larici-populina 98AG31]